MKAIQFFQREHQALLGVAGRLQEIMTRPDRDLWQVQRLVRCVDDLRSATLLHVVVEDEDFYPRVARCGHGEIQARILRLRQEAGNITQHFEAFLERWRPQRGVKNYDILVQEAGTLLTLLQHRVREEEAIFQLIHQLGVDVNAIQVEMHQSRLCLNPS